MFDSPLGHCRRPPAVLSLTSILAAALLVAAPAHGFGLSGTQFVEGLGKVGDAVKSAQEAERHGRSDTEQFVVDKTGEIADKATDAIGQASIKLSRKAWDALKKSDSKRLGELAKKTAKRWGPAAMKALRLAGPVGTVVATADASITVGSAIAKYGVIPLIAMHHDSKSRELQEQILRDVEEIRKRGEFSRKLDEDIAAYQREARAMEEEERALYRPESSGATSDPWSDNAGGTEHDPGRPAASNEPNPWEPDVAANERATWPVDETEQRLHSLEGNEDTNDPWSDDESDSQVPVASNVPDPWGQDDATFEEQRWSDQEPQGDWTVDDDPWSDDENDARRDSLVPVASNVPDPWGQDGATFEEQRWSDQEPQGDWTADDEGADAYAAALANVFDESTEHEAEEDDYNNALAALERLDAQRREAEEREAQRIPELEAENRRRAAARLKAEQKARERQAQRAREAAQLKAQRDEQRQEAERRKARLEEERRAVERAREEEAEWRYAQRQREERERRTSSSSCLFGGCGEAERMFEEMQRQVQQGREASRRRSDSGGQSYEDDCVSTSTSTCSFQ